MQARVYRFPAFRGGLALPAYELWLCMAASLDGRIAEGPNQTPGFTSRFDRHKLFALRAWADLLLVGAGTVREEIYPPLVRRRSLREQRSAEGRTPHPAVAVLSRKGELPLSQGYLAHSEQERLLICAEPVSGVREKCQDAGITLLELNGRSLAIAEVLEVLALRGYRKILAEGGGRLCHSLLESGLVTRFHLTLAPLFLGGDQTARLVSGPSLCPPPRFELRKVEHHESELHLLYVNPNLEQGERARDERIQEQDE